MSNMLIEAQTLLKLVAGSLTEAEKEALVAEAQDALDSHLVGVAHDHQHGVTITMARLNKTQPVADVAGLLLAYDSSRFEVEEDGPDRVDVDTLAGEILDLRNLSPVNVYGDTL